MTATTTLTPWSSREDISAAIREEQAQREALVDPQTNFADQLYDRVDALYRAALPSTVDLSFLDEWRSASRAPATPSTSTSPSFTQINADRLAAVQSQVNKLIEAMASFAPPAALESRSIASDGRYALAPLLAVGDQ